MAKYIYVLGAGASCRALPLVSEMGHFLEIFANDYSRAAEIPVLMKNMIDESSLYPSPDVYARTLFLREDPRYKHFNNMLSLAFFWKQNMPGLYEHKQGDKELGKKFKYQVDPRYLALFSSLIDKPNGNLPEDLGFILWNYDSQIERALEMLKIGTLPKIVRLNGTASVKNTDGGALDSLKKLDDFKDNILALESQIKYGWDDQLSNKSDLAEILSDTEHIIFIGYSFPVYNRFTDAKIFEFLNESQKNLHSKIIKIDLVGQNEEHLARAKEYVLKLTKRYKWRQPRGSGIDKIVEPEIETIASPDNFPIPHELAIFGRPE